MKWYQKLLYWGFCGNYWGFFHALSAGVLAKIGLLLFSPMRSLLYVALIAVLWEIIEFFVECKGDFEVVRNTYKSVERWAYDSAGDIILAVACATIVVI